ncbi:hypothetical protein FQN50_007915 [Emmonsiellopsis sp. PD_5]|nr:hypothetical protein FQN50_007915 [Emmonsiellopsis sp. PD_5]
MLSATVRYRSQPKCETVRYLIMSTVRIPVARDMKPVALKAQVMLTALASIPVTIAMIVSPMPLPRLMMTFDVPSVRLNRCMDRVLATECIKPIQTAPYESPPTMQTAKALTRLPRMGAASGEGHRYSIAYLLRTEDDAVFEDADGTKVTAKDLARIKYNTYTAGHDEQARSSVLMGGMEEVHGVRG